MYCVLKRRATPGCSYFSVRLHTSKSPSPPLCFACFVWHTHTDTCSLRAGLRALLVLLDLCWHLRSRPHVRGYLYERCFHQSGLSSARKHIFRSLRSGNLENSRVNIFRKLHFTVAVCTGNQSFWLVPLVWWQLLSATFAYMTFSSKQQRINVQRSGVNQKSASLNFSSSTVYMDPDECTLTCLWYFPSFICFLSVSFSV